jgi:hypothetical protein
MDLLHLSCGLGVLTDRAANQAVAEPLVANSHIQAGEVMPNEETTWNSVSDVETRILNGIMPGTHGYQNQHPGNSSRLYNDIDNPTISKTPSL